ncbi:prephenate dehydratase [Candidatus Parvarchaeota archaeon]|nr:prephenate dehydratase [Candidatus Parvarchaeota archaeon]
MDYSKFKQGSKQPLVAFQGEHGAYSEQAIDGLFSKNRTTLPCSTFREVFEAVGSGEADYGLVPIENSLEGSVNSVYDLLLEYDLHITKETMHRITHCLVAAGSTSLSGVEEVYSHPQALGQCKKYLEERLPYAGPVPYYDTAGAAKMIAETEKHNCAAIASRKAADYYGLKVLAEDIGNSRENFTRFLLLSRQKAENCLNPKTSIVFAAKHKPGALYHCLKPFAERKINLTKLESRPAKQWEYVFYMDFVGDAKEKNLEQALGELSQMTSFIKVLGVYESAKDGVKK